MLPLSGERARVPSSHVRLFSRVGAFDLFWAIVSPVLAFYVRDGEIKQAEIVTFYFATAGIASLIAFQWFRISSPLAAYFSVNDALTITKACLTTVALTTVVVFTFTRLEDAPRSVPLIHFMLLASGLISERVARRRLASAGHTMRAPQAKYEEIENILVIGATRLAWFFVTMTGEFASNTRRIVAVLDERPALRNRTLKGCPIVGTPAKLSRIFDEYAMHGIEIGRVVIAAHPKDMAGAIWIEVQAACKSRNVAVEWLSDTFALAPAVAESIESLAVGSEQSSADADRFYWRIKRALDFMLALGAMVTIVPLTTILALLVLIDVGYPVVFWQQRIGHLGRPLFVYKFRTMRNSFDRDGRPVPDARRVSILGMFLRKNRLDEIPQLFNILMGNMSIVGPRPLLPIDQPTDANSRLLIRPGLTGLAQINGGKLLSPEEKDALDAWYLQHASILIDLQIIARTVWVVLRGDRRNENEISSAVAEKNIKLDVNTDAALSTKQ